jgi:hypothetical protein
MKFLNGMQQFRAHTGGYKATAFLANGLRQPDMLGTHAASKRTSNDGLALRRSLHGRIMPHKRPAGEVNWSQHVLLKGYLRAVGWPVQRSSMLLSTGLCGFQKRIGVVATRAMTLLRWNKPRKQICGARHRNQVSLTADRGWMPRTISAPPAEGEECS